MAYDTYGNTETKDIAYQSQRTRSSSTICVLLVTHQIPHRKLQWSKQKLNLMCNINDPKFPCRMYAKSVYGKVKAVQYNLSELWSQIKFNKLNYLDHRYLQNCDASWYCINCFNIRFNSSSNNKNFLACCTVIATSHSAKIQKMIIIAHQHYNLRIQSLQ